MTKLYATLCLLAASCLGPAWAQDDGAGLPRVRPQGPGMGKLGGKKGIGARRGDAAAARNRFEAFTRMSPEDQEKTLDALPAPRRVEMRRRLEAWKRMTPEEREKAIKSVEEFRSMPVERQQRVRELFAEFSKFPLRRRALMRREVAMLRNLEPEERRARINAEEFRSRFTAEENRLLADLAEALPRAADDVKDDLEE